MKLIFFSVTLWVVIATAFSSKNTQYSDKQLQDLTELSRQLQKKELAFVNATTNLATGQRCISDFECPYDYDCVNVKYILHDYLVLTDHLKEREILEKKANIFGKECVRKISSFMKQYTPKQILDRIKELVGEMNKIFENDEKGLPHYGLNATDVVTARMDIDVLGGPITRVSAKQGYTQDFILPLVLATRGTTSSSLDTTALITLLALSPQGFGQPGTGTGTGSNPISNPLLLYVLLNDQNTNTNNNNIDLLVLSLALSPGGFGGLGGNVVSDGVTADNGLANPLILYSLLNDNNNSGNNIDRILPFLLLGGGLGGTGTGYGNDIQSLLPLLILQDNNSTNDLLLILALSGGAFGGYGGTGTQRNLIGGGSGIEQYLPLLLLSQNNNNNNNDLLLPLLISGSGGYGGGGIGSIIPLLLLTNSSLFGSSSSSGNNNDDLALILLASGGLGGSGGAGYGSGGLNNILPLLFLLGNNTLTGGTSGNSDDTLLYLLLFGGLSGGTGYGGTGTGGLGTGGLGDIWPILLLRDSSSSTDTLTLAILFSQLGQGGFGGGGGPVTYPVYG